MARVQIVGSVWSECWKNRTQPHIDMITRDITVKHKYLKKYEAAELQEIKDLNLTTEDRICAICLKKIKKQALGRVPECGHLFCASCLIEWFNRSNICPLDRQFQFYFLVCKDIPSALTADEYPKSKTELKNYILYRIRCGICQLVMRDSRCIICDSCSVLFHISCINPPVKGLRSSDFYCCPDCRQKPIHKRFCLCPLCSKKKALREKQVKIIKHSRSLQQKSQHRTRSLLASRSVNQKVSTNISMLRRYLPLHSRLKLLNL